MKQILIDIIESFADKKIIFSNEEQLQFQMAIELSKNGYDVSLEVLSMENNEKMYTDIVVKNKDNTYTAIELKYKLQDNDIIKINTNKTSTPSREWINMAYTAQAKNKIKNFYSKREKDGQK